MIRDLETGQSHTASSYPNRQRDSAEIADSGGSTPPDDIHVSMGPWPNWEGAALAKRIMWVRIPPAPLGSGSGVSGQGSGISDQGFGI